MARRAEPPRAWQRMLSGRRLDILDPAPLDVEIEDIAHGLARVARWNGQTRGANIFSVAQHSLLVEALAVCMQPDLPPRWRLAALLHDAPEYVIGDIISPFKAAVGASYKEVENRILAAIHIRYSLPPQPPPALSRLIKRADRAAAFIEATRLAGFGVAEAEKFFGRPEVGTLEFGTHEIATHGIEALLEPMAPGLAQAKFLAAFEALEKAST